jgi:hypothetical protein
MKPATWKGFINIYYLVTGKRERVQNAILDDGLELTGLLWLGQSTEQFSLLQIEGAGVGEEVSKPLTGSYTIDTGLLTVTSVALFGSAEVTFDVTTVALIGSEGTRIAEATVNIPSGNAVEITREDELSEVA